MGDNTDVVNTTEPNQGDAKAVNAWVISEFRKNNGKVGGRFEGSKLLILHTTGQKTGQERLTPLVYLAENDRFYVFAAGPGLTHPPDWYHNLRVAPNVTVEVGTGTFAGTAREISGEARERIWDKFVTEIPQLPGWQRDANREFQIIEIARRTA